tara:strand:- start:447 stop:668 length:222 start_codon:yes stop_codon:yes gene_type:complete
MKSKKYILMQLKELMTEKFGKSDEEADAYIEEVKMRTVYELLVLKKELKEKKHEVEEDDEISTRRWFRGYFTW